MLLDLKILLTERIGKTHLHTQSDEKKESQQKVAKQRKSERGLQKGLENASGFYWIQSPSASSSSSPKIIS
jgi:hypothetical protein